MGAESVVTEWSKTKKYNPAGPGYPEAGEYYVLKAEAEAKLRGAHAEIERQKGLVRNYLETIEGNEIDIAGLLEKLRAVGELPGKWRGSSGADHADTRVLSDNGFMTIIECAAELEALLK